MAIKKPTFQYVESFEVIGYSAITKNSDELSSLTAKIPTLWQQASAHELLRNTPLFGVYSDFESDANGLYKLTVGALLKEPQGELSRVAIQSGEYLVFKGLGLMPETVIATWKYVWDYFATHTQYSRSYLTDFESYPNPDEVSIYIGVV